MSRIPVLSSGLRLSGWARRAFSLSLIATLCLPVALSAASGDPVGGAAEATGATDSEASSSRHEAYQEALLRVMEAYHLPGVVAGVWVPGKRPWKAAEGFAEVATGKPISLDHRFPIRSATKSFTVTLILKLVRRGQVALDDPIGKFVQGIPNGDEVTLAHLAAMESGVKSYEKVGSFIQEVVEDPGAYWTPESLVGLSIPESPLFPPGSQYDYSNTNCILLGMVLESVTQKPLAELYRRWIFKPLGLRGTSYPDSADIPVPHPTPYTVDPGTGAPEECPVVNLSAFGASGGMVSTLRDLHRWGKALGKGTLVGPRLQKVRLQHARPATSGPEYDRYGLGIGELRGWWGHTGEGLGHQAAVFYDPKSGAVIAVLVNSSQPVNAAAEAFKALAEVVRPAGAEGTADP